MLKKGDQVNFKFLGNEDVKGKVKFLDSTPWGNPFITPEDDSEPYFENYVQPNSILLCPLRISLMVLTSAKLCSMESENEKE